MKIIKFTILAFIAMATISSCKKEEKKTEEPAKTIPDSAKFTLQFYNQVSGQDIEFGKMQYVNTTGNMYQIDLLKYYATNIILVKSDNSEFALGNYDLINAADPATCMTDAHNVPNGTYTKIKFNIGVPLSRNHSGAQDGDLDAALGMIWDWNTGYVFFKHEGKFKNSANVNQSLIYHFATDRAFTSVEVPLSSNLVIEGIAKKVSLIFNLNKLYSTPVNIDFNTDPNHQSSSASDYQWIDNMKTGFGSAFTFNKIE